MREGSLPAPSLGPLARAGRQAINVRGVPSTVVRDGRSLSAAPNGTTAVARALELLASVPEQIVHGDSHPGNVLWTRSGPLWADWEDAHLAPLEWDLACLVAASRVRGDDFGWAEAALRAHGGPHDAELLEVCVDARVAQGATYLAFTGRGGPEVVADRVAARPLTGVRAALGMLRGQGNEGKEPAASRACAVVLGGGWPAGRRRVVACQPGVHWFLEHRIGA
jgi:Phosphotransferase enzyme family